jgi:hypothetical protein
MLIVNPKLGSSKLAGKATWYPYYAGFSPTFARAILKEAGSRRATCVLDPWNGTGTTTELAVTLGLHALGFDLNPVMLVIARARLLREQTKPGLVSLAKEILADAKRCDVTDDSPDPLLAWLRPASARHFRRLESSIQTHLVQDKDYASLGPEGVQQLSNIAAFFYTALFRTLRHHLQAFFVSNPTWIRNPKDSTDRVPISSGAIGSCFLSTVRTMAETIDNKGPVDPDTCGTVRLASSEALPLEDRSVDWILTSPPYCTRIDYAVATRPELALLGIGADAEHSFHKLRRSLIGSTTVPAYVEPPSPDWGPSCIKFLNDVNGHTSKASSSYYYKQHVQYFRSIYISLSELCRVLRAPGSCVIVVQDSHYKEIHNPVPDIIIEMALNLGLSLISRTDYETKQVLAQIHPGTRKYRSRIGAVESVLTFAK